MGLVDLGLPPDYFWALTLREFEILLKRHRVERYRLSAHVCAFLAEMHRDTNQRAVPFTIEDFLPGYEHPEESPDDGVTANALEWQRMKLLVKLSGGEDLTEGVNIQIMGG